jgi:molybdopterin converting factor small subunit
VHSRAIRHQSQPQLHALFLLGQEVRSVLRIHLKLYGVFRAAARSEMIHLDLASTEPTVRSAIAEMVSRSDLRELQQLILDGETLDPRPNALIMVSGREIGTLNGLDTKLTASDEVSLLPIAHGG